jgi:pilus assembly protein CpaC
MTLEAGSGRVFQTAQPIANLFAADPKIAEARPASPTSVFVFGVAPGRTTIAAMDQAGHVLAQYQVTVRASSAGAAQAAAAIASGAPGSHVKVEATPATLVATGTVANAAQAERVSDALHSFASGKQQIDNRTTVAGAQIVNLRVRIAEISRQVTRQLGINWAALGTIGRVGIAGVLADGLSDPTNPPNTFALAYHSNSFDLNAAIDLLAQDGLIKILAEPNLTAQSGETASFLAGGEFPIPVAQQNNTISIDFKQYGVSLAFVPTVVSPGHISLRVRPEVSELTNQGAVSLVVGGGLFGSNTLTIPALTVRRAETTVELGSGQSFAIAGLLQSNVNITDRGLPWLGTLPVLGALFSSNSFQHNQSELVIVVTPYLVRPVSDPKRLATPADDYAAPNDIERIFYHRQRAGDPAGDSATHPAPPPINTGFILD